MKKLSQALWFGREGALLLLIALQASCTVLFLLDVLDDIRDSASTGALTMHLFIEISANVGLSLAIVVEILFLRKLLQQQKRADKALSAASGALNAVIQGHFTEWGLTGAEADVAFFTIKGFSIAEIAQMRGSAEGTVKSQLNAIYRKSGLAGRGQLVSLLIEDLLAGPLPVQRGQPWDKRDPGLE
ncbi:MAG: helix-turn-helix transcriptional regulator [Rhodobacteraceae bacterium]|nr:helix-turn-helix transcriptional regulator [Paracoccaceae bacterium]